MTYKSLPASMSVTNFWFSSEVQPFWFLKDSDFDENLRQRFGKVYEEAVSKFKEGKFEDVKTAEEALSYVIVLDQFSRNMFRDTPKAFATDDMALTIAKMAVEKGLDRELTSAAHHNFLYMPYMHSENLMDQEDGIRLFSTLPGNEQAVSYARQHRDIIIQFGRFPHRNKILGRVSTPEEIEFEKVFGGF